MLFILKPRQYGSFLHLTFLFSARSVCSLEVFFKLQKHIEEKWWFPKSIVSKKVTATQEGILDNSGVIYEDYIATNTSSSGESLADSNSELPFGAVVSAILVIVVMMLFAAGFVWALIPFLKGLYQ